MKPQGLLLDCVYCNLIHPELKGKKECPHCHGQTPKFKPMQMMDKTSSEHSVMNMIIEMKYTDDLEQYKKDLIGLLTEVEVYNFDLKSALITIIRDLENGY